MNNDEQNDFLPIVEQWFKESTLPDRYKELDGELLTEFKKDYAQRLESIIFHAISNELDKLNKSEEFNETDFENTSQTWDYLKETIPDYNLFIQETLSEAKRKLIGI
jgi:hypothetical protein